MTSALARCSWAPRSSSCMRSSCAALSRLSARYSPLFSCPRRARIDAAPQLQCQETLRLSHIRERTCQIAPQRRPLLEITNRCLEVLQRVIVPSLAQSDTPVSGLNVPERDEVIRFTQNCFGFLQNAHRFLRFAVLEYHPAF